MKQYPALHGMVEQLPIRWTAEKRQKWLDALTMVLDASVVVYVPRSKDEVADGA